MANIIIELNNIINNLVWGTPILALLIGTGIFMTVSTRFFQFTHFKHWLCCTFGSIFTDKHITLHTDKNDGSISQFQSLCTTLAATLGTGNIVGVASAIILGGPGSIFWMWVVSFFGMMTTYSENVLGIFYRRKNSANEWCGGPMYYLQYGLGSKTGFKHIGKFLATAFAGFCVLASFGIGNMSQVNSIAGNMQSTFGISPLPLGLILMLLGGLVILGGIKRIANVTEKLVPFMAITYILMAITVCIVNIKAFPQVISSIFAGAFGLQSATGGIVGGGLNLALTWGMKRGIFSNEAGLGSSAIINSCSNVTEPVRQGMWGIFEVFADTIVLCSLTGFAILSSGLINLDTGALTDTSINAAELAGKAFATAFGSFGPVFMAIAILMFAFATVLGWSHYGSKAFEFLFGEKYTYVYKIIFVWFIFIGSIMKLSLAWDLSDTFNGLMAIPNLIGVLGLSPMVVKITRNYMKRTLHG